MRGLSPPRGDESERLRGPRARAAARQSPRESRPASKRDAAYRWFRWFQWFYAEHTTTHFNGNQNLGREGDLADAAAGAASTPRDGNGRDGRTRRRL